MASFVHYKFRSQKNESRVQFNGPGISVFDLKHAILLANNLGKANDFDLAIYDQYNQEYKDDTAIIPRSSSVIASRLPSAHPGRGNIAHYLSEAPIPASCPTFEGPLNSTPDELNTYEPPPKPESTPLANFSPPTFLTNDETASIAAMFAATAHQWEETQVKMSQAVRIPGTGTKISALDANVPRSLAPQQEIARPVPPGYICFRCGLKGHLIQYCPTNNDREFDNRPRIKRTTGIPRSFLKTVDRPIAGSSAAGVMITSEGHYVVAQPDAAAWQKQKIRTKTLTEADIRANPSNTLMTCALCSHLLCDTVKTACCGAIHCEECIQTHLSEHDFECPACHSRIPSIDKILPELAMRARVQVHIDRTLAAHKSASSSGEVDSSATTPPEVSNNTLEAHVRGNKATPDAQQLFPEPAQIKAQIDQLHTILKNPALSQEARMRVQMQLPFLTDQFKRACMIAILAETTLANASHLTTNLSTNPGGANTDIAGYGNDIMSQPTWNSNEYHPQRTSAFTIQQPAGPDSPYERLPVNNRHRSLKRGRPSEFSDTTGDDPVKKIARYWE